MSMLTHLGHGTACARDRAWVLAGSTSKGQAREVREKLDTMLRAPVEDQAFPDCIALCRDGARLDRAEVHSQLIRRRLLELGEHGFVNQIEASSVAASGANPSQHQAIVDEAIANARPR